MVTVCVNPPTEGEGREKDLVSDTIFRGGRSLTSLSQRTSEAKVSPRSVSAVLDSDFVDRSERGFVSGRPWFPALGHSPESLCVPSPR